MNGCCGAGSAGWRRLCPRQGVCGVLLVVLIAAAALAFRLDRLELRPLHVDEAVQAVKAGELYDSGHYIYNPFEFHGPSLYYLTLPVLRLSGARCFADAGEATFRLVPVMFGAGLILLLLLLRRDLGMAAGLTSAALLAVSPAMVFFSRYYIQEMVLVFFAALALGALWRFFRTSRKRWVVWLGLALGMMYATKETSVIFAGVMAGAYGWLVLRRRAREGCALWHVRREHAWLMLLAVAVAAVVAGLFYSSWLAHPRGPLDSLLAFGHYFDRSGGDGSAALHQQPWYYYLQLLAYTKNAPGPWWSEGLILALAGVGFGSVLRGRLPAAINPELAGFLAVYALGMTLVFALIPYKTPWNLLGFLHGLILMAGIGASALFHRLPRCGARVMLVLLLVAGAGQLAAQAARAKGRFCADPRNPYVYAHSGPDVVRLARRISELAALHADGAALPIHIISPDYWPLPYYLRKLQRVGYWTAMPPAPDAPLIVVSAAMQEQLEPLLRQRYHAEFYGLRPGVLLVLNVEQDLWQRYLLEKSAAQAPPKAAPTD